MTAVNVVEPYDAAVDRQLVELLGGPVEPETLRLLWTMARGDLAVVRALVVVGVEFGVLSRRAGRWVWAGASPAPSAGPAPGTDAPVAPRLTPREREVLGLLGEGLTAAAIAHRLGVSRRTVTKHQEKLYRKMGTADRLGTVLLAQRLGMM
ncbi:hypothetical protein Val02_28600 [Virgisporangium aliadipatigenens]|uniref:HTH luxR-type domain-containing protein n=1 Tax=Virgisporangium aliadipatigenens TaxID=741659 RepID=A0A8J3YIJ6_9ACTN|nr:helix-turn-helix transcriptional regulator [Virgisporangium aliadipatigenens]GIJ45974.1 hypothetical protein Val02_28600 [Virgisporangium aliadipatigenens]